MEARLTDWLVADRQEEAAGLRQRAGNSRPPPSVPSLCPSSAPPPPSSPLSPERAHFTVSVEFLPCGAFHDGKVTGALSHFHFSPSLRSDFSSPLFLPLSLELRLSSSDKVNAVFFRLIVLSSKIKLIVPCRKQTVAHAC